MLRKSVSVWRVRLQVFILSMLAAVLGLVSESAAVIYDLNVANGNYNVATNWIDHSTSSSGVPGELDAGIVRNGGTLNITAADGDDNTYVIRVGAGPQTDINALEGVDPTPPPTYGGAGTLNWTGGNILGNVTNSVGPRLNVGQRDDANNIDYTGIVNQSGGTINLSISTSFLNIGSSGATSTPTSIYNLLPGGTISISSGGGGNNGVNVRNGTFNMTGGSILWGAGTNQRAVTVANASGTLGNEATAYANFSGGTVDVYGGMRIGTQPNSKGYVTISGSANLQFRTDVQLGTATNNNNSNGQVDMSGGTLTLGDLLGGIDRKLIVGDQGNGVFNLSGGTVILNNSLAVGNNPTSNGLFYQTGGTLTVRNIEMNRNSGIWDLSTENAAIIIDGPSAVFTQENTTTTLTGKTVIGQYGKGRFEIRQGQANLREILPSEKPDSRATLNVFGGILRVQDDLNRTDASAATIPTINLTGGELELTPVLPATAFQWQASMVLQGTDFDPRPGGVLQVNLGNPTRPGDFALKTGSVWDLDIASNTLFGGADWVDVNNGTATLNGGVLNIHQIGGYTPVVGDEVTIVRNLINGIALTSLSVSDPHWQPYLASSSTELRLKYTAITAIPGDYNGNGTVDAGDYVLWRKNPNAYGGTPAGYNTWRANFGKPPGSGSSLTGSAVPEPNSIVLVGLFASALVTWRRGSRRVEC